MNRICTTATTVIAVLALCMCITLSRAGLAGAASVPKASPAFCTALGAGATDIGKSIILPGSKTKLTHQKLGKTQAQIALHMKAASKIAPTSNAGKYLAAAATDWSQAAVVNENSGKLSKSQTKNAATDIKKANAAYLEFTSIPGAVRWCNGRI
jgi:hypothetical protein